MKKYDTYKDSGIEWLGEIPEHWKVVKVKHVLKNLNSFRVPLSSVERANMKERIYDYYGASGVIDKVENYIFEGENILIGEDGANLLSRSKRLAFIASGKYWVNNHAHILKPREGNITYFSELMEIYDYTPLIVGAAQPKLTQDSLMNIEIIEPPISEQNLIAFYLNHKTTQIDTLIEKKEQLVEKLTLKRQAIINEAVTKGLNPNVPMKDSGIEWLGEIPEHWEVVKFRHLIDILTDFTANGSFGDLAKNVTYIEEGYSRLIRLTDLRVDLLNKGVYLSEESHNYLSKSELFGGEVLLANVGAYSGLAWLMPYNVGKASLGPNMLLLKFKDQLDNKYAYHAMISKYLSSQFKLKAISAAQPKINKEDVRSCIFILPPKKEQMEINIYLDSKDLIYNSVSEKLEIQIAKLKLYRQSLISEAVTGKIDLRDWKQTDNK